MMQHAQFYKNFRVISTHEDGHLIDSSDWVRTFSVDTSEFYDGENLISAHVHPMNVPGQPYIADFSVQAFKIVAENDNPAPTGDVRLPTLTIDPSMMLLLDSTLLGSKSERWTPSFGQLSGQIKVKSGFIDQAASGCDEVGQSPGLGVTPTLYASSGVRSPSDECGRRLL